MGLIIQFYLLTSFHVRWLMSMSNKQIVLATRSFTPENKNDV